MINVLKPRLANIALTVFLAVLIYLVGQEYFNNPVWLKTGCAPDPSCPTCERCKLWGFPGIINIQMLPLLVILYLISSLLSTMFKKK